MSRACRMFAACVGALVALALALPPTEACAQDTLVQNDFEIDIFTGPALSSSRIVGLGGAYAGISDGIDGVPLNPASYAARTIYELAWFEWELSFGFLLPGAFAENDFDNNGSTGFTTKNFLFLTFGLRLQFGNVGFGFLGRSQSYRVVDPADPSRERNVTLLIGNFGFGYQFFQGQLVLGLGARLADLDLQEVGVVAPLVSFTGTGADVGVLWRPAGRPFRIGVGARTPVQSIAQPSEDVTTDAMGVRRVRGFVLPSEVHVPWEVSIGAALQVGRPLNMQWHDPDPGDEQIVTRVHVRRALRTRAQVEREMAAERAAGQHPATDDPRLGAIPPRGPRDAAWLRAEAERRAAEDEALDEELEGAEESRERVIEELSRIYVLFSAEALFTGPTSNGVGLESFLAQVRERSGETFSVGLRLGAEGEPWPGRIKLRLGTYLEPSRFEGVGYRVHGTGGIDIRLFSWDVFGLFDEFDVKVNAVADIASRYFDWGVGIGVWH